MNSDSDSGETGAQQNSHAAFTYRSFRLFAAGRVLVVVANEMLSVAVGWQLYAITRRPLVLGLAGLAVFLPGVLWFLLAGHAADRFARKNVLVFCNCGYTLCAGLLLYLSWRAIPSVLLVYVVLVLVGTVRCFEGPSRQSLLAELVAPEDFPNALAWNGTFQKSAAMLGPVLGGVIYGLADGPVPVYLSAGIAYAAAIAVVAAIQSRSRAAGVSKRDLRTVLAGLDYIRRHRIVLGAISLDLFAVLLGGAVALLPVYARDILRTGPWGLGLLRAAPGIGSSVMALLLAHINLRKNVGAIMLWAVAVFGAATVVFGLSRSLPLSLAALFLLGAGDMISVIVRGSLIQLSTPNEMRGRVSAVNMLFVGTSNELGQFESGVTAAWFGTVPAVVLGGVGTLAVVALWAWGFPELRRVARLSPEELAPAGASGSTE